ncbi:MAG: endonuclease/exonuclease/phosphatase family protein [Anaerolineales bacterium]
MSYARSAEMIKIFLAISITLFFFQALRTLFSSLFGIIYDQIFVGPVTLWLGTSSLLILVALIAPSFIPERFERGLLPLAVTIGVLARLAMTLSRSDIRYWSALIVVFAGALFLRVYLERTPREAIIAILGALVVGQLLRNLGTTYDLSLRTGWLAVQFLWSLLLLAALFWGKLELPEEARSPGWLVGLAFGAFLFLETSLLSLPNGIYRWSDWSYLILVPALLAVTAAPLIPAIWDGTQIWLGTNLAPRVLVAMALLAGLAVGYFLEGPRAGLALLLAQGALLLSIVVLFGVERSSEQGGLWLPLGFVLFLLLNYFNAFTFTYPYTLPAMRGLGWTIYLIGAAMVALTLLIVPRAVELLRPPAASLALLGGAALIASLIVAIPGRIKSPNEDGSLTIATYNIHYGFDEEWAFTLDEQIEAIRNSGADVIALQEVDAGRLTSYSVDNALYMARRLGMQAAFFPTIEHLTGIAVLYRGPQAPVVSQLLTSNEEQTGIIGVDLALGEQSVGVFAVWIGLDAPEAERQVEEALEFIGDRSPVAFAGDFNLEHGDPAVERIKGAGFIDPFQALGMNPPPPTHPAIGPVNQIDFVWLRGLAPTGVSISESLASDHRLVASSVNLLP